jgi:L-threonylcarbamoyladenylate synthase
VIIVEANETGFLAAVAALRRDEIVAYPTETVYGLAVNPFSPAALERLWRVKGRDAGNPVLLIVCDATQLDSVASAVSPAARRCIEAFWPGPLTLLLPKSERVPMELTAGRSKVAVRQPGHAAAMRLCREAGMALTSTSANVSGHPAAMEVSAIELEGVSVCIDGGRLSPSGPSTIYDPDEDSIVRAGPISREQMLAAVRGGA